MKLLVANRGEDKGEHGEQVAYLVTRHGEERFVGKTHIALGIVDWLEKHTG